MIPSKVLNDAIEREKAGTDYMYPAEDRPILREMLGEINAQCGTNIQYLAELDAYHVIGAGNIIVNYIEQFSSESVRAYLIPQLLLDKIKDCDKLVLHMYLHFRDSKEYIAAPGKPAPAHIYVRYDNAFRKLKSKRIVPDILRILVSPRDAFYLPLTAKMLASWKVPELKQILLNYLAPNAVSMHDVGLCEDGQIYFPSFSDICNELKFTAMNGLVYYPSEETLDAIQMYVSDPNKDLCVFANKIYKKISLS